MVIIGISPTNVIGVLPIYEFFLVFSVEYCNASAEAMVSNPVKALNFFFLPYLQLRKCRLGL